MLIGYFICHYLHENWSVDLWSLFFWTSSLTPYHKNRNFLLTSDKRVKINVYRLSLNKIGRAVRWRKYLPQSQKSPRWFKSLRFPFIIAPVASHWTFLKSRQVLGIVSGFMEKKYRVLGCLVCQSRSLTSDLEFSWLGFDETFIWWVDNPKPLWSCK